MMKEFAQVDGNKAFVGKEKLKEEDFSSSFPMRAS